MVKLLVNCLGKQQIKLQRKNRVKGKRKRLWIPPISSTRQTGTKSTSEKNFGQTAQEAKDGRGGNLWGGNGPKPGGAPGVGIKIRTAEINNGDANLILSRTMDWSKHPFVGKALVGCQHPREGSLPCKLRAGAYLDLGLGGGLRSGPLFGHGL